LVNAVQTNAGRVNAFVAEINAAGSALVFSTYLGGSTNQNAFTVAVDSSGAIYVGGDAVSADFPVTANALSRLLGGSLTPFVTKLSPGGASLVYSTYLGGNDEDDVTGIAVDSAGNAYVAGQTYSTNFPTVNAFQSNLAGGENEYVAKINAAGTALFTPPTWAATCTPFRRHRHR